MEPQYKAIGEAVDYIQRLYKDAPEIGIVLGTGLGGLCEQIHQERVIPYNFIPHFPLSTAESHFGRLIFGTIGSKKVVAMQGRLHFYEGYAMEEITFPIRVMRELGVHTLLLSGASGAMNLDYQLGDLMVLDDHINLQLGNPLVGPNLSEYGVRFPDMSLPYDPELKAIVHQIASNQGITLHEGVYVSVTGPNLETRAEYRFLRMIGGDVVGMSTVPEVLVARHMNLRVCAIAVVTDICDPDNLTSLSLEEVIQVAEAAEPKLSAIFRALIEQMP